ncbi:MAG: hypothetical protein ACYS9X_31750 [Planctomycetota bacterium]
MLVLVLVAMGLVTGASHIVALGQLSIPVGAALGVVALKEPRCPAKCVSVAVIMAGLLVVAAG